MALFKVIAKCGHVGKERYYRGEFFVKAENAKVAAAVVRNAPRVKHHHKDAILAVVKIGHDEYVTGRGAYSKNPYFKCRNVQQQRQVLFEIQDDIFFEDRNDSHEYKRNEDRLARLRVLKRSERKAGKYGVSAIA
jgi:hypothetical protein